MAEEAWCQRIGARRRWTGRLAGTEGLASPGVGQWPITCTPSYAAVGRRRGSGFGAVSAARGIVYLEDALALVAP